MRARDGGRATQAPRLSLRCMAQEPRRFRGPCGPSHWRSARPVGPSGAPATRRGTPAIGSRGAPQRTTAAVGPKGDARLCVAAADPRLARPRLHRARPCLGAAVRARRSGGAGGSGLPRHRATRGPRWPDDRRPAQGRLRQPRRADPRSEGQPAPRHVPPPVAACAGPGAGAGRSHRPSSAIAPSASTRPRTVAAITSSGSKV